jgi:RsiW-degrading membrane proteinase PrsW (M82 family)
MFHKNKNSSNYLINKLPHYKTKRSPIKSNKNIITKVINLTKNLTILIITKITNTPLITITNRQIIHMRKVLLVGIQIIIKNMYLLMIIKKEIMINKSIINQDNIQQKDILIEIRRIKQM